ncbi:MAG: SdrD B-like domain-containing protein [Actinomycetaceae bacterium]|nr:SdrD B-like domain-containing protein [Actinomycetaceae bacterium]
MLAIVSLVFASSAAAQDAPAPTLAVRLTPNMDTVSAGDNVTYTVDWSCASNDVDCENAAVGVEIPRLVYPDGTMITETAPEIVAATNTSGVVSSPAITRVTTRASGQVAYSLGRVPAGTAGQATITVRVPRGLVPKDSTLTPVVTFSSDGAAPVTQEVTTAVDGAADLAIFKSGPQVPPVKGAEVTYTLHASYDASLDDAGNSGGQPGIGHVNAQNVVVTDQLPACAVYVSSNVSGNLDAIENTPPAGAYDEASHTVTWNLGAVKETFDSYFTVTVRYPADSCTEDSVTNNAQITGEMYRNPAVKLSATADFSHGFGTESAAGAFRKNVAQTAHDRGGAITWNYSFNNTGNVPLTFTGTDVFPCALATPQNGATDCPTPLMKNVSFRSTNGLALTLTYTTNLGNTGTVVTSETAQTPIASDAEWITAVDVEGTVPAGVSGVVVVTGTIDAEVPRTEEGADYEQAMLTSAAYLKGESDEWVRVQNCFAPGVKYTTASGRELPIGRNQACNWAWVVNDRPMLNLRKLVYSGSPQAPGGNVTFRFDVTNFSANTPVSPVVSDLLPCGMSYVDGSAMMRSVKTLPADSLRVDASRTVTDEAGCTRQLVTFTWPDHQLVGGQWDWLTFEATVGPGTQAGRYSNQGVISPEPGMERAASDTTYCYVTTGGGIADTLDLNGNGRTDDLVCPSSVNYDVIASSSMSVTKEVKGSRDEEFQQAPSVGVVQPGKSAEYRLTAKNTGNVALDDVVLYDVLPDVGDTGVGPAAGSARGSQWTAGLSGPVSVHATGIDASKVTVQYSTSSNACRGEVVAQGGARDAAPVGCTDDWTDTPASYADVRAIRVQASGVNMTAEDSLQVTVPINAPDSASGTAWNSVAMAGHDARDAWLLPIEPVKVGLQTTTDLEVSKTVAGDEAAYGVGDEVHFQVTVKNVGAADATQVQILDSLPEGLQYASSQTHFCPAGGGDGDSGTGGEEPCQSGQPAGAYDPASGIWTLGQEAALSRGTTATLDLRATVAAGTEGQTLINEASLSSLDQVDDNPDNDAGQASLSVLHSISGTVYDDADSSGSPGDQETGIGGVTVELRDSDGEVVAEAVTAEDGAYAFDRVPAGTYTVVVVGGDGSPLDGFVPTGDPDSRTDGRTEVAVGANAPRVAGVDFGYAAGADLSLTKAVRGEAPEGGYRTGDELVYELTVDNAGPAAVTGVTVADELPDGVEFVSAEGEGNYDSDVGLWRLDGELGAGGSARLAITVRVSDGASGEVTNSAEVASADQKDPDSTPGNGGEGEDDADSATISVSDEPTTEPSGEPTPSESPSGELTDEPSESPSTEPSESPSGEPSESPSGEPSTEPGSGPSNEPSSDPSSDPSSEPGESPSTGSPDPAGATSDQSTTGDRPSRSGAVSASPKSEAGASATSRASGRSLARTGADVATGAMVAVGLVVAGGMILFGRKRREN